ncbi:MAG TPA: hypothetical protein P5044_03395, partial [bacterium]|nr:hypothetical protein [bacterium]
NGDLYLVFSNNSDRWTNRLLKYETLKGRVSMVDSGLNAFAANPVEYSAGSKKSITLQMKVLTHISSRSIL